MEIWNKFVVLEGLDGAGTTSQLKKMENYCLEKGIPAHATWEPSTGFIGRAIRDVLEKRETAGAMSLAQLFAADRREHLKSIKSHLDKGKWVFCDRYLFSSLAYQSLDLDFDLVFELNKDFPLPQFCFYLDCSPATSARRREKRAQEELFEKQKLQNRVIQNYEQAFHSLYPRNNGLYRINGERPLDEVFKAITEILPFKV